MRHAVLVIAAGCARSYLDRAPVSPREAWPMTGEATAADDAPADPPRVARDRVYGLPELIDLAESTNPDTRIGWERARQAALGVGVAKAGYFPTIAAIGLLGFQHSFFPAASLGGSSIGINPFQLLPSVNFMVPTAPQPTGRLGVDTWQVLPFVALRWEVFDMSRGADVRAAENLSTAANAQFTAEHQRVMFEVARAFFRLTAARAQVAVSTDALARTRVIAAATDGRYDRGLATVVDTSEARREVAQAEYVLTQTQAAETGAYAALVTSLGVDPQVELHVADRAPGALPERLARPVAAYVESGLRARADLRAARERLPATEALVARSEATYVPRVSVTGTGGGAWLGGSIDGFHLPTLSLPNYTGGVNVEWLLFDGGLREVQTEVARSRRAEAAGELTKLHNQVVQEVVTAYDDVNANLSRYRAATALVDAAATAEAAATKSYDSGLVTLGDLMNAERMPRSPPRTGRKRWPTRASR